MKKHTVSKILRYTIPHIKYFILAVFSAVISVSLTLYIHVLVGNAIDYMIDVGRVDFGNILLQIVYIAVSIGLIAVFQWLMGYCTNAISSKTIRDIRSDVFRKFNNVPLSYIDRNPHGDLISRITNDIEAIGEGLTQVITQLFSGVITIIGTLIFMLMIDYRIALVVVVLTPLSILVAGIIGRMCAKSFREQQALQGEISSYIEEMVGNQKIVKAFSYEKRCADEFEEKNRRLFKVGLKAQFAGALANPCTRFVNNMVYAATGIVGALLIVMTGGLSIGQLSCFLAYANQYTKPFNEVTGVLTQIQTALASAGRVFEVLEAENEPSDKDRKSVNTCKGKVEFKNVYFSYSEDKPLIQNFSLNVKSGQQVAIVGPTGCGKTTLINLLMGFYDVQQGEILVDGTNILDIKRNDLRKMFGMVLQDSWLISGTIMENLRFGNPNATDEQVIEAAKQAHAHSFIRKMPQGYNTLIAENGGNLSAGQKQLLCIARAMVVNPPMLILDEATSSIDTLTEIRVQKAFRKLMKGKTSFVVAHRLSTIKESDIILVMNKGNIVEQGTHEKLLEHKGFYYNLYNSQFANN
ncbi:MAG: ABC transporter ATP-binding protein [Oscillospiraceae bacterium]|nr:ABC transporter ATP-binding protein [Oscillospiraceae bacterium]